MKNIVSTIRLPDEMIAGIKEVLPQANYEHVRSREMTARERERAEIFITYGTDMTEEHVPEFKNLKWIMVMSAGLEMMPLDKMEDVMSTKEISIHKIKLTENTVRLIY